MNPDLIKFKHVLEYFVTHQNYLQSNHSSVKGYEEYIEPFIESRSFYSTGQGWNDDSIQKQIAEWENIASHRLCINVQPNFGDYTSKKCYLNWIGTGINIFCNWNNGEVVSLSIGFAYWWMKPTRYKIELTNTVSELGLFDDNHNETILSDFYNRFVKEIEDFDNHKGDYYNKCAAYKNRKKQDEIMNDIRPYANILKSNYNMILTGAPGTGKTYLAKQIAQLLIFGEIKHDMTDDEKKQFDEQSGFVQFHPNYDYTDFVEGLRPIQDEKGNIGFERRDGIFKEFCKKAIASTNINVVNDFNTAWDGLISSVRDNLIQGNLTDINGMSYGLSSKNSLKYTSTNTASQYSFTITKDNVYHAYCGEQARPSGAYQTHMEEIVNYLIEKHNLKKQPIINDSKHNNYKFVFIIDEINRGEISKIFGELFYSIDPGYRGTKGKVKTQYQNLVEEGDEFYEGFYIPENVYIIGTMNDIDRSVESMDFAMRRRFAFKEVSAEESMKMFDSDEAWRNDNQPKPDSKTIGIIKYKMKNLNNIIWHKSKSDEKDEDKCIDGLSSAYHIGASYFLKIVNYRDDNDVYNFDKLWEFHLEGLLREYLRGMQDVDGSINKLKIAYNSEDANINN